jgi:hypothetical protein
MDAEAQFLQSRKARLESRGRYHSDRRDGLNVFWTALKARLTQWKDQLHALGPPPSTEEEKRLLRLDLCRLEEELKHLRKSCLTESSSLQEGAEGVPCAADLMTLSDLGLLHTEFSQCQASFDLTRKKLLPRGKFVFRRYREAIQLRHQQADSQQVGTDNNNTAQQLQSKPTTASRFDPKRTLMNIKNRRLLVHFDGEVTDVEHPDGSPSTHAALPPLKDQVSSLVLCNLENCEIEL